MDSSNSAVAPDPDKRYESKSDDTNLSDPVKLLHDYCFFSDPVKLLHDYCLTKGVCDESETPIILDALFNTISDSGVDTEEYHKILDQILIFDYTTNELNYKKIQQITEGIEILKEKEMLKLLSKKGVEDLLKFEIAFKEAYESYSKFQSEIKDFKFNVLPNFVIKMNTLQEKGSLFPALLFKPQEIITQCINLSNDREGILRQMEIFLNYINNLILNTNNAKNLPKDGSKSGNQEFKHKKETTSTKNFKLEKACIESKKSICRSEHNTPFCKNCGWRTSWLKNFKKRGVYIKEADKSASKQIWYNNVNTD